MAKDKNNKQKQDDHKKDNNNDKLKTNKNGIGAPIALKYSFDRDAMTTRESREDK